MKEGPTTANLRRQNEEENRRMRENGANNSERQFIGEENEGQQRVALIGRLTIGKGPSG